MTNNVSEKEVVKTQLERKTIRNRVDIAVKELMRLAGEGWVLADGNSVRIEGTGFIQIQVVKGVQTTESDNGGSIKVLTTEEVSKVSTTEEVSEVDNVTIEDVESNDKPVKASVKKATVKAKPTE